MIAFKNATGKLIFYEKYQLCNKKYNENCKKMRTFFENMGRAKNASLTLNGCHLSSIVFRLMRFEPVFAESDARDERNFEFHGAFHFGFDHLRERFDLIAGAFEHEFVMHLEHHAEREVLVVDALLDADHGDLDEVGGTALHGGIHGHAFGHLRFHAVAGVDACDVAAASGKCFYVAVAVGGSLGVVDELLHALVHFEVTVDKALGLPHRDFQVAGEAEGGHAVEHAEVHHLGVAAHVGGHVVKAHAVDGRGGAGVDVDAFLVALDECFVTAQVGEHAEFNLRVVHRENHVVRVLRHECGTDLLAEFATDGDVLQVRIAARKAACRSAPLDKACVDALGVRVHECGEYGNVRTLHLLEFAVFDDCKDDGVGGAEAEFFEDGGVRAALFDFGEAERVKEHFAELLGRTDVEFETGHVADFFFELFDAVLQIDFEVF